MANTGRIRLLRDIVASAAVGALVLPWGSIAPLQGDLAPPDAYGWDAAGIIAGSSELRLHTVGTDIWEVWVCDTVDGSVAITPGEAVSILDQEVVPYFEWLSDGIYQPVFVPGGTVDESFGCLSSVRGEVDSGPNGVLIVTDIASNGGTAQAGIWCPYEGLCPPSPTTYPDNFRSVIVDAHALVGHNPRLVTVVHEIGHTLHFPHVYSGATEGTWREYDDPTDVMSQAGDRTQLMGTLAVNRYAAGWFAPEQVATVTHNTVELGSVGEGGTQLVVIPMAELGHYVALSARTRTGFDTSLPYEGVTVHVIDQRPEACGGSLPCFALSRRSSQWPIEPNGFDHLIQAGESVELPSGHQLEVVARTPAGFLVRVTDVTPPGAPGELLLSSRSSIGFDLTWVAAGDNTGVEAYQVAFGGATTLTAATEISITGLVPDTAYPVSVRAVDAAGNLGPAAEAVVRTLPEAANLAFHNPRSGRWHLANGDGTLTDIFFGVPDDLPMVCDWDGDGIDTVGLYRRVSGFMYLRNSNTFGVAETEFFFGMRDDLPVCGDWDGDGVDSVGIYRPSESTFYLRNRNDTGFADEVILYGNPGDIPIAGDWDGDGKDEIGIHRPSSGEYHLRTGETGWMGSGTIVRGDFDGDGRDTLALYDTTARLLVVDSSSDGSAAVLIPAGGPGWNVLAGWWG